jgi:hypothetical protein
MQSQTKECIQCGDAAAVIHDCKTYFCAECYLGNEKNGFIKYKGVYNVEQHIATRRPTVPPTKVIRRKLYG